MGENPGIDDKIKGYGFKYDNENTKIFLELANTDIGEPFIDKSRLLFFNQTMSASNRVSVDLPISEKTNRGKWVGQASEPTCLPWAVSNAILALGFEPDVSCVAEMLNMANDVEAKGKAGMHYFEAQAILEEHSVLQIKFEKLDYPEIFSHLSKPLPDNMKFSTKGAMFSQATSEDAIRDTKNEKVNENGKIVKKHLDSGEMLLVSVSIPPYENTGKHGSHAVCIGGYRINKDGLMDVRVVDSNRGKIWMSLEHLSESLIATDGAYKMSRR